MANRKSTERGLNSSATRSILNHTKTLGRTAAGAMALAVFLPMGAIPAYAATADENPVLTIEDLATVSEAQIATANSATVGNFSSADLIARVAEEIDGDRKERERIREAERVAAEKAAEEARLKAEAEVKAEAERKAAEEAAQIEARELEAQQVAAQSAEAARSQSVSTTVDVPPGKGAEGVVAAAKAQLGVQQDCTDLVQNSLAAVGLTTRRDQGGFDLGTGIWQYDRFGPRVSLDALAPGDILVYGNAGTGTHVAIYIGDGQAVHGGFNGSTVIASMHSAYQPLTGAVRPGA